MELFANTPAPPYYAVVFTSLRMPEDSAGYAAMAEQMAHLAAEQPGYLGIESARAAEGIGITVSYWESTEAIEKWHRNAEHRIAQRFGREKWYQGFQLRVCRVERAYAFDRDAAQRKAD